METIGPNIRKGVHAFYLAMLHTENACIEIQIVGIYRSCEYFLPFIAATTDITIVKK